MSTFEHGVGWDPEPAAYLARAMAPAEVREVELHDGLAIVRVPKHLMPAAVGQGGLNRLLAGRLAACASAWSRWPDGLPRQPRHPLTAGAARLS